MNYDSTFWYRNMVQLLGKTRLNSSYFFVSGLSSLLGGSGSGDPADNYFQINGCLGGSFQNLEFSWGTGDSRDSTG